MKHRFDFSWIGICLAATLLLLLGGLRLSAASTTLNYQGRVIANGVAFQGTGQFKFALISADGSTYYWKNDASSGSAEPASAVGLAVNRGLFSVRLGDTTIPNMTSLDSATLANAGVKLRVWFNDGVKGFQQISPDQGIGLASTPLSESSLYLVAGLTDPNGTLVQVQSGVWSFYEVPFGTTRKMWIRDNCAYSQGAHTQSQFQAQQSQTSGQSSSTIKFSLDTKTPATVTGIEASASSSDVLLSDSCAIGQQGFYLRPKVITSYTSISGFVYWIEKPAEIDLIELESTPPLLASNFEKFGKIKTRFLSTSDDYEKLFYNSTTVSLGGNETSGYQMGKIAVVNDTVWIFTRGCAASAPLKSMQNLFIRNQ